MGGGAGRSGKHKSPPWGLGRWYSFYFFKVVEGHLTPNGTNGKKKKKERKAGGQSGWTTVGFKTRGRTHPTPLGCSFLIPPFTERLPHAKKTGPCLGEGYGLGDRQGSKWRTSTIDGLVPGNPHQGTRAQRSPLTAPRPTEGDQMAGAGNSTGALTTAPHKDKLASHWLWPQCWTERLPACHHGSHSPATTQTCPCKRPNHKVDGQRQDGQGRWAHSSWLCQF